MDRRESRRFRRIAGEEPSAGGIILIGEPFWRQVPPTEGDCRSCFANSISDFLTLPDLVASFGGLGCDVVEMVLADQEGWDRYEAAKWLTMRRWLAANPGDDLAAEVRELLTSEPGRYVTYTREYLGWGVFGADDALTRRIGADRREAASAPASAVIPAGRIHPVRLSGGKIFAGSDFLRGISFSSSFFCCCLLSH